jgi:hypothetical protein
MGFKPVARLLLVRDPSTAYMRVVAGLDPAISANVPEAAGEMARSSPPMKRNGGRSAQSIRGPNSRA